MFLAFFGGGGGGGGLEETRKRNARKVSFQKINLFHSGLFLEEIYIYKHSLNEVFHQILNHISYSRVIGLVIMYSVRSIADWIFKAQPATTVIPG